MVPEERNPSALNPYLYTAQCFSILGLVQNRRCSVDSTDGDAEAKYYIRMTQEWHKVATFWRLLCHLARPGGESERGFFGDGPG
jgi:hypothetical protein